ncbi:MAG TPA: bifunctional riboflavin kinase/FAD synthetase [Ktedonobacteraceae bacterium]|nr:bifunctional riboflavin kinase/FAD synthetase [Ktedonobacteraceae bacterium]
MDYTTTLADAQPIAITIGNFDGIHRGHQRLLSELRAVAQEAGATPVMVTFSPHTLLVVRPGIHLECLTTLHEKLGLAKVYGHVADSIVVHFTPEVAALTAREFLDTLEASFPIRAMVVGDNFSLGHNRMGDVAFLQEYGQEHDMLVRAIRLEVAEHERISSTRIRSLVHEGRIAEANELLGHPVVVSGIVAHGDQRGRLLGFPTANLLPEPHKLLPANGVYAARVTLGQPGQQAKSDASDELPVSYGESQKVWNSAVNVGVRPTFDGHQRLVEAHLLDADLDLYGQEITINFIARLRSEQRFNGLDALKAQIAKDTQETRRILQNGDEG